MIGILICDSQNMQVLRSMISFLEFKNKKKLTFSSSQISHLFGCEMEFCFFFGFADSWCQLVSLEAKD